MIRGMAEKVSARGVRRQKWFLYILRCADGSLYTGITNDLDRRLRLHGAGKASRYTRTRRPVELVYRERCIGRARALVRECAVKDLGRARKLELIGGARATFRSPNGR